MSPDSRLESMVSSLSDSIDWPIPSHHLAARVAARIESEPALTTRRRWGRLAAAVAGVLVVTMAMLFSPSARQAVADLLGAAGIRIGMAADQPVTTGAALGLGEPISLNEAADVVNFDLRVPAGGDPGPPDGVYLGDAGEITMVWADGPALPAAEENDVGLLLTQRESNEGPDFGEKLLDPETEVQRLSVESRPALWIESAAHALTLLDTDGNRIEETTRLAANVLLWEANGVRHRLETTGDLHSALAVVEKLERLP